MKKIFTLTLGVLLTLSSFAIPQSKKAALGQLPDKQSLRQTEMIKSVYQGVPRTASKMAKAPKATTSVTILAYTAQYYSSYNVYIYDLRGDNGLSYSFAFPSTGEDMVVDGQTYTLSDMDAEWSYWYDDSFDYADYTVASFTKTTDANGNVKIIASVTDTNGDVWNLLYDQASLPETPKGGTYSASSVEANYFSSSSDIQYALEFEEDKLKFYFDIILPSGVKDVESGKTYTLTDMDEDYSFGQYNSANYIIFSSASFTKTVAEDGSYTIAAVVVDEEGNTWNLSASQAAPSVKEQTLTLNGILNQGETAWQIEAADADSTIIVSLLGLGSSAVGEFTEDDFYSDYSYVLINSTYTFYSLTEANITITQSDDKYLVTGTMKTANDDNPLDQIIFTLNLTVTALPNEGGEEEDDTYKYDEDAALIRDFAIYTIDDTYLAQYGSVYVEAEDEYGYYIILDVTLPTGASELVAGTYTIDDSYGPQTVFSGYYNSSSQYSMTPSFAATLVEYQGDLYYDKVWWIVSGTVTVDTNGKITVNAVNSKEQSIQVTLGGLKQGIENAVLSKKTQKIILDGSMYIIRDNKMYNIQGARVR
jgi:hypothetical protein